MFYLFSETKSADQLHGYRTADLPAKSRFSHDKAQMFCNCDLPRKIASLGFLQDLRSCG